MSGADIADELDRFSAWMHGQLLRDGANEIRRLRQQLEEAQTAIAKMSVQRDHAIGRATVLAQLLSKYETVPDPS